MNTIRYKGTCTLNIARTVYETVKYNGSGAISTQEILWQINSQLPYVKNYPQYNKHITEEQVRRELEKLIKSGTLVKKAKDRYRIV